MMIRNALRRGAVLHGDVTVAGRDCRFSYVPGTHKLEIQERVPGSGLPAYRKWTGIEPADRRDLIRSADIVAAGKRMVSGRPPARAPDAAVPEPNEAPHGRCRGCGHPKVEEGWCAHCP